MLYKYRQFCQETSMNPDAEHFKVIEVFSNYGFRKTSMSDLAEAAGVSRQTLYNRFKSKEDILHWAMTCCSGDSADKAVAALEGEGTPQDRIVTFFARWIGDYAPKIHSAPHGPEIFDMAMTLKYGGEEEPASVIRCREALVRFLMGIGKSGAEAVDAAFTMMMASKGLMLVAQDTETFVEGMGKVVDVVV